MRAGLPTDMRGGSDKTRGRAVALSGDAFALTSAGDLWYINGIMALRLSVLDSRLAALEKELGGLRLRAGSAASAVERWRADGAALRFHLSAPSGPLIVAILGGTGTGKSTLVNRLLEADLSATSFRRTFTSGAVAIARQSNAIPAGWLGVAHHVAGIEELPARGQADSLIVVPDLNELTDRITLVDTPDLDGDQPLHHAQADRVFRWAQAVVFLVSPEKYQMTELIPYYRLARRYAVPALFVMNKAETGEMVEDYGRLVEGSGFGGGGGEGARGREGEGANVERRAANAEDRTEEERVEPVVFAIPRDDAGYEPLAQQNLLALREAIKRVRPLEGAGREAGLSHRAMDLVGRGLDQVIAPLRQQRKGVDEMIGQLRALETPPIGVDVNPITQQLQRRLQQRSVLYLMGPARMLDRVRQVPGLILRLPRTAWDVVMRGQSPKLGEPGLLTAENQKVPDFPSVLKDQFAVVQSRIEDVLRSNPVGEKWLKEDEASYAQVKFDPKGAGAIAEEELGELKEWLEKRWNATPRDTLLLQRLLKYLPGGQKLTQWSEAAPYLLVLVAAAHHLAFSGMDLLVIGGFSVATWLTEKLSNEVASRTRATNRTINQRFTQLAHRQIENIIKWLDEQVPANRKLDELQRWVEQLAEGVET